MPTIKEVLLKSGMTEDAIKALDAKVMTGLEAYGTEVQTGAQAVLDRAELERRAAADMYQNQISPALNDWSNKETQLTAQIAFYKTQAEAAKTAGFIPTDAPGFVPPPARAADGTFVPGGNPVPGSPGINVQQLREELGGAFNDAAWAMQTYQRTHGGKFLEEDISALAKEAVANRMEFRPYLDKKFGFSQKLQEQQTATRQAEMEKFAADKVAERDKYWAERTGGNPDVRQAVSSQYAEIRKGVADKTRPDPLSVPREQRHAVTSREIQKEIATRPN